MAQPTPSSDASNEYALVESSFASTTHGVLYKEVRRIQKLASAMFLVTQHLKDTDLVKRHLRNHALDLLDIGHVSYDYDPKEVVIRVGYMMSHIDALMSFIEVARATTMISGQNALLLARELASLHLHLSGITEIMTESSRTNARYTPDEDLDLAEMLGKEFGKESKDGENFKSINDIQKSSTSSQKNVSKGQYSVNSNTQDKKVIKDIQKISPTQNTSSASNLSNNINNNPQDKVSRKGQIITIIKDMGEVTIKDIASRILRCSEKTLQRDLQDLLNEKTITKTGDRRWSKYKMA